MKKKLLVMSMTICLVLAIVAGATLAYFTDKDTVKNEFAIGNIDIDVWEIAGIGEEEETIGKDTDDGEANEYTYKNLFPTQHATKQVHVTNNSSESAYVRVAVVMNNLDAINRAIDETYESMGYAADEIQEIYDEVFQDWGVNYEHVMDDEHKGPRMWMTEREDDECLYIDMAARIKTDSHEKGGYYVYDITNWFQTEEDHNRDGYDVHDGTGYYEDAVKADERIYVFYLKLDAGKDYVLFNGLNVPAEFTQEQAEMFSGLNISVYADAIQTTGFDTAEEAFTALNKTLPIGHWYAE